MIEQPATIALTAAQLTVGLLVSIVVLVGSGFAFGGLVQRQKNDHDVLHKTLKRFDEVLSAVTRQLDDMHELNQKAKLEHVDFVHWRLEKDEDDAERDESIAKLENGHGNHETRLVAIERPIARRVPGKGRIRDD